MAAGTKDLPCVCTIKCTTERNIFISIKVIRGGACMQETGKSITTFCGYWLEVPSIDLPII